MSGLEILEWLENNKLVKSFEVLEFKQRLTAFYLKLKITFIDDSSLHTKEYIDENERNYSFHWQDKNEKIILRWDNAPHHKDIKTFPHHLHKEYEENVHESYTISLKEVFEYIENQIK